MSADECPRSKFPDGTRCGDYGWHALNCPQERRGDGVDLLRRAADVARESTGAHPVWTSLADWLEATAADIEHYQAGTTAPALRFARALLDGGDLADVAIAGAAERRGAERALLEAADEWRPPIVCHTCLYVDYWLRDRAAQIGADQ